MGWLGLIVATGLFSTHLLEGGERASVGMVEPDKVAVSIFIEGTATLLVDKANRSLRSENKVGFESLLMDRFVCNNPLYADSSVGSLIVIAKSRLMRGGGDITKHLLFTLPANSGPLPKQPVVPSRKIVITHPLARCR